MTQKIVDNTFTYMNSTCPELETRRTEVTWATGSINFVMPEGEDFEGFYRRTAISKESEEDRARFDKDPVQSYTLQMWRPYGADKRIAQSIRGMMECKGMDLSSLFIISGFVDEEDDSKAAKRG